MTRQVVETDRCYVPESAGDRFQLGIYGNLDFGEAGLRT